MAIFVIWVIGYLIYVWATPAKFDMVVFLIPAVVLGLIDFFMMMAKR